MKLHKTVLCNLLILMQVGYNHADSGCFIPSPASSICSHTDVDIPVYEVNPWYIVSYARFVMQSIEP